MEPIFEDFKKAFVDGKGYLLAQTLSPVPPPSQPQRLYNFFRSTNFSAAQKDFKYQISYNNSTFKLQTIEANGWVEVYYAYWKAVGEVLNAENAPKGNTKASFFLVTYWTSHALEFSFNWKDINSLSRDLLPPQVEKLIRIR